MVVLDYWPILLALCVPAAIIWYIEVLHRRDEREAYWKESLRRGKVK